MPSLFRRTVFTLTLAFLVPNGASAQQDSGETRQIVLIGGDKSHGPFVHDAQNVVAQVAQYLETSPDIRGMKGVSVKAYPKGWPSDPAALDNASTIVWCFDGLENHPLLDPKRRAQFERLAQRGVGLVTFHQASTLPPTDKSIDLVRWLGGARYGMVDRTTETVAFTPSDHPVSRGVHPFAYRDEFYPTVRFGPAPVAPILTGALHLEAAPAEPATTRTVAWAFDRQGGGRSFGFTGLHYLASLEQPDLRKLLLNAIIWTAGIEVPKDGVDSGIPRGEAGAILTRAADTQYAKQPWGELRWFTSAELNNSPTTTTGQATVRPGQETPRHFHPDCDEILRVVQGRILQTVGSKSFEMNAGDVISIPEGLKHGSKNIGTEDAVLALSYPTGHRRTIGE